ncbi:hypothetical protein DCS_02716 [Drechmeria coniospora]|uniref:Uncharacterized protein n=1 Tax=Drechmeria coniospora TaxID=98403 RepID=A0A151GWU7_DRECN|nr:hypothetical protein DCS_02716 [Drechmeria coniospora]KYK61574.1 hypothetical protein DCS_02716 [Drechmeria coniospora]
MARRALLSEHHDKALLAQVPVPRKRAASDEESPRPTKRTAVDAAGKGLTTREPAAEASADGSVASTHGSDNESRRPVPAGSSTQAPYAPMHASTTAPYHVPREPYYPPVVFPRAAGPAHAYASGGMGIHAAHAGYGTGGSGYGGGGGNCYGGYGGYHGYAGYHGCHGGTSGYYGHGSSGHPYDGGDVLDGALTLPPILTQPGHGYGTAQTIAPGGFGCVDEVVSNGQDSGYASRTSSNHANSPTSPTPCSEETHGNADGYYSHFRP